MNKAAILSIFTAIFLLFASSLPAQTMQANPEDLKGKEIRNQQGETLGTIEEVETGPDGQIEAVTVEEGGFLGLGEEENRIPWNQLKEGDDPDYLVYTPGGEAEPQKQAKLDQQKSGQVMVRQPGAEVDVDQSEPQVQVKQSEPEVEVQQEPPKVAVEQPAPEIQVKVEQPKPEVSVQQQQPKVDLQQEEPKVAVKQEKPEVEVKQQKPEVRVEKSEPEVQVEKSEQAQVYVEEQEQAQVEIEKQGEPQVEVITEQQQKKQRKEEGQQMAQKQQEQQMKTVAKIEPAKADEWLGKEIVGKNGETLGTVEMNYLSEDRTSVVYVIVQGEEDKMHPVPADMVRIDPDKNELMAEIDKQNFQNSPMFGEEERPQLDKQEWSQEIRSYYGEQEGGQSQMD